MLGRVRLAAFKDRVWREVVLDPSKGLILRDYAVAQSHMRLERAEAQLRRASGAFMEVLEGHFCQWGLTPAERDVAFFVLRGCSTAEIAALRNTSEGTVKAQTNAIYRKAGVTGRGQLMSVFIDDLLADELRGAQLPVAQSRKD